MKIALAQMKMSMDRAENLNRAVQKIQIAGMQGADLVLFPEVMLTPFFAQYPAAMLSGMGIAPEAFAITEEDDAMEALSAAAKEAAVYVSPNIYIKEEDGACYDRSYLLAPDGRICGHADMVHIFSAENFWEKDYYTPSKDGFKVFDTPFGRIGIVICFDRHIPEAIRSVALQGASIVLIPAANLTGEPLDVFEAEIRAAAYQNNVYIAMCNRVGEEDALSFAGQSVIVGPDGTIMAKASGEEELLCAELDISEAFRSRAIRPYIGFVSPNAEVYHMAGESESLVAPSMDRLFHAMCEYDKGDAPRIQHFTKVWTYAKLIGHGEGLDVNTQNILEAAAILHDIGIHKAEKGFSSSAGSLQEKLGPGEALKVMTDLGFDRSIIARVCYLIGHHHTYTDISGIDYQILVEADFLVNILEDSLSSEEAENAYKTIFQTATGKKLFRDLYPEEGPYDPKKK
jgi:predicted amidohydrolase